MINYVVIFFILFKFVSNNQQIYPEPVDDFYQENDKMIAVIDDIFITLKINNNFKKFKNVTEYMAIHRYIQDAVENRIKKYKEINNVTKNTPSYKTDYYVSHINKALDEIINDKERTLQIFFSRNKYSLPAASDDILTDFVSLAKKLRLNLKGNKNMKPTEDTEKKVETRRLLGIHAEIKDWPFVVSIHIADNFICAGSIIREDLVLTAGSCFEKLYKKKVKKEFKNNVWIRAGSDYVNNGGVTVQAVMLHFHPRFNPVDRSNNIVVVQLKLKLRLEERLIVTINLAKKRIKSTAVDMLKWGNKEPSLVEGNQIMYDADMDIENRRLHHVIWDKYNMIDCISAYPHQKITNNNFCAGSSHQGSDACNYDLGGPGVIGIELHGVVSFGPTRCDTHATPTVFTKVFKYARWLDKLFHKITLTNDTVEDSGQMYQIVKPKSEKSNVLNTYDSYVVSEIKKDIQANYNNLLSLYLPIEKDETQIILRESNLDNPLRNNIYLDPTLENSTEIFEKLKAKDSTPTKTDLGDETDQVSNWVHYKKFMAQILNNKGHNSASPVFGVTDRYFAQGTAPETTSLLSEMQEEYDAEFSEQKFELEYNGITHNMPNNNENNAQTQKDILNDPNDNRSKLLTQNIEFEYEDMSNSSENDENIARIQSNAPNDPDDDKNKREMQNVIFQYEDVDNINNDENKELIHGDLPNDPNDDNDKLLTQNVQFEYEDTPNGPNNDVNKAQVQHDLHNDSNNENEKPLTENVQFVYEDTPNSNYLVNTKQDANDIAEIIISDSGTTHKLLLNKKDPEAVKRFVTELTKLKDRIDRTSTTIFYRELEDTDKRRH